MAKYEYLHTWIPAIDFDMDAKLDPENIDDPYQYESIQKELNSLGRKGWELINMTPLTMSTPTGPDLSDLFEEPELDADDLGPPDEDEFDVEAPSPVPHIIIGYYCTFKRVLG